MKVGCDGGAVPGPGIFVVPWAFRVGHGVRTASGGRVRGESLVVARVEEPWVTHHGHSALKAARDGVNEEQWVYVGRIS